MQPDKPSKVVKLIIGSKNYSSWSVRPWLLLQAFNIPFEEICISLYSGAWREQLAQYTHAGKVPVLHDNGVVVWDSLAICEYISEQYLAGRGWPAEPEVRAEARSCCAEMHSGFFAIRENMPMNCRATGRRVAISADMQREIARVDQLWGMLRQKYSTHGPWLFGRFSIADCMYAPMVFRFNTYGVGLSEAGGEYAQQILAHPAVKQLFREAGNESESIAAYEVGV
jgi:glutathione S-transferase